MIVWLAIIHGYVSGRVAVFRRRPCAGCQPERPRSRWPRDQGTRVTLSAVYFTRFLTLSCLAGMPAALAAPPGGSELLDLPFEDLLQVEVRSAGKRDEQIRDIPASVTILTREEIARYGWVKIGRAHV